RAQDGQRLLGLAAVLVAGRVARHRGAGGGAGERDRPADAARAPGHEYAMAGELAHARPAAAAATSAPTCPLWQTSSTRKGAEALASASATTSASGPAAAN